MNNIKAIPTKPNADVVELCEQLLAEAKSGKIRSVAVATVESEGVFGTAFECGDGAMLSLVGSVSLLKHDVITEGFEHD